MKLKRNFYCNFCVRLPGNPENWRGFLKILIRMWIALEIVVTFIPFFFTALSLVLRAAIVDRAHRVQSKYSPELQEIFTTAEKAQLELIKTLAKFMANASGSAFLCRTDKRGVFFFKIFILNEMKSLLEV